MYCARSFAAMVSTRAVSMPLKRSARLPRLFTAVNDAGEEVVLSNTSWPKTFAQCVQFASRFGKDTLTFLMYCSRDRFENSALARFVVALYLSSSNCKPSKVLIRVSSRCFTVSVYCLFICSNLKLFLAAASGNFSFLVCSKNARFWLLQLLWQFQLLSDANLVHLVAVIAAVEA